MNRWKPFDINNYWHIINILILNIHIIHIYLMRVTHVTSITKSRDHRAVVIHANGLTKGPQSTCENGHLWWENPWENPGKVHFWTHGMGWNGFFCSEFFRILQCHIDPCSFVCKSDTPYQVIRNILKRHEETNILLRLGLVASHASSNSETNHMCHIH